MDVVAGVEFGVLGAVAGIPVAAISFSVAATGPVRLPRRWWTGAPARPAAVAATSIVAGVGAAIPGAVLPISPALISFWLFAVIGVGLAIIDVRRRRLPHLLTGALWITSLVCFTVAAISGDTAVPLLRAIGAGIATAAFLFAIALALPGQLGLGDIALASGAVLTLSWISLLAAAFGLTFWVGLQAVVVLVRHKGHPNAIYPMGPALIAGWAVAVAILGASS